MCGNIVQCVERCLYKVQNLLYICQIFSICSFTAILDASIRWIISHGQNIGVGRISGNRTCNANLMEAEKLIGCKGFDSLVNRSTVVPGGFC